MKTVFVIRNKFRMFSTISSSADNRCNLLICDMAGTTVNEGVSFILQCENP